VKDEGPGIPSLNKMKDGVGISSVRARLERLYGAAHRFELRSAVEGGLTVRLAFPFEAMIEPQRDKKNSGAPV